MPRSRTYSAVRRPTPGRSKSRDIVSSLARSASAHQQVLRKSITSFSLNCVLHRLSRETAKTDKWDRVNLTVPGSGVPVTTVRLNLRRAGRVQGSRAAPTGHLIGSAGAGAVFDLSLILRRSRGH